MDLDLTKCLAQEQAYDAFIGPEGKGNKGASVCLAFGRGIGKSWLTRVFWYLLVKAWDGCYRPGSAEMGIRIVLLMPTIKQAKRVHGALMVAELGRGGAWGFLGANVNKTDWRVDFPGGSWIQWVSAENVDDNRGIRCDAAFIDEADDVDKEIVDSITKPWFSEPHSLRLSLFSGTPRRGRYGLLYKTFKEDPEVNPEKCFGFHATGYDAPLIVDPEYLEDVKKTTTPEIFAREWMCDFDAAEGLVYPMWSDFSHVKEPWLPFHQILIGVDHGWQDPAIFLVIGVAGHGRDAVAHCIWEYCESQKTIEELCEVVDELGKLYPHAKWYADSAAPEKIRSYEKRINKKITHATHKIEDGVAIVANLLFPRPCEDGSARPHMYVSPKCPNLISEMGKYRRKRDPKNTERVLDDIAEGNDHSQDALRYACLHYFGQSHGRKTVITEHQQHVKSY